MATPNPRAQDTTPKPAALPTIQPELLTCKEAARLVGCGERTWWRWTRCGLAPAPLKIGIGPRAAVRYRKADIIGWINGGCKPVDGRAAK